MRSTAPFWQVPNWDRARGPEEDSIGNQVEMTRAHNAGTICSRDTPVTLRMLTDIGHQPQTLGVSFRFNKALTLNGFLISLIRLKSSFIFFSRCSGV